VLDVRHGQPYVGRPLDDAARAEHKECKPHDEEREDRSDVHSPSDRRAGERADVTRSFVKERGESDRRAGELTPD